MPDSKGRKFEDDPWDAEEEAVRTAIVDHLGPQRAAKVSDEMMVTFIRGYHYEEPRIPKTIEVLERCLEWREELGVDRLLEPGDPEDPAFREELRQARLFRQVFHLDVWGKDDSDHCILCHRIGSIEPKELLGDLTMDQVKRHFIRDMEYIVRRKMRLSIDAGCSRYKHVSILDFSGFGTKHMGAQFRKPMKEVLDQLQFYYPEVVKKLYVVNAPMIFRMLWRMVKPWLHPVTVASIDIIGGDFSGKFAKAGIPFAQLPKYLGGEKSADDGELLAFARAGLQLPPDLRALLGTGEETPRHTPMTPRGGRSSGGADMRRVAAALEEGTARGGRAAGRPIFESSDEDDMSGYLTPPMSFVDGGSGGDRRMRQSTFQRNRFNVVAPAPVQKRQAPPKTKGWGCCGGRPN